MAGKNINCRIHSERSSVSNNGGASPTLNMQMRPWPTSDPIRPFASYNFQAVDNHKEVIHAWPSINQEFITYNKIKWAQKGQGIGRSKGRSKRLVNDFIYY